MKKLFLVTVCCTMLMLVFSISAYGANINVNGADVVFTETTGYPYIDENYRTQVPLRVTMEKAGAKVTWDSQSYTAIIEKRGTVVKVPIGVNYIDVDGKQINIDTSAIIKDGRTYLPIRPVLEAFNFNVNWDNELQTVFAANYYDYLENQETILFENRKNISTTEELLEHLISSYRLEKSKDQALKLAEREYLDKLNEDVENIRVISYFEWYNREQLEDIGILVDDSSFFINKDKDFNYTYRGKLILNGKDKTITINLPNHVVNYLDSEQSHNRTYRYDGVTIHFSFGTLEFKGEDLVTLGLIK